jgi:hypothetical protein
MPFFCFLFVCLFLVWRREQPPSCAGKRSVRYGVFERALSFCLCFIIIILLTLVLLVCFL